MEKVLLICESGISSNFLAKSAEPFIELHNLRVHLIPTDIENANVHLDNDVQLVLVAPQASYRDEKLDIFGNDIPVEIMPDEIYGWGNGEKLVKLITEKLKSIEAA